MTIKTKISLGLAFLFTVILLLGGLGSFYLYRLSQESANILKDNYVSLEYVQNIRQLLEQEPRTPGVWAEIDKNLAAQEQNITEPGEGAATRLLRETLNTLRDSTAAAQKLARVNRSLNQIADVNMQAMVRKNAAAENTAREVRNYMVIILTVCLLVTFSFIINFPGYVADPIRELTLAIKEVAAGNYDKRLGFASKDEFGDLSASFNDMARQLDEYAHSNLSRLMFEKKRIETIVDNLNDAILGLDERNRVLFLNPVMERLTGLAENTVVGQYTPDVALRNDLLRTLLTDEAPDRPLRIYADGRESYFTKETLEVLLPAADSPGSNGQAISAGRVVVLRNITSFKELDLAKTNFIATISHELKTPIASLKMSLRLLENEKLGTLNAEQRQLLAQIGDDAGRLLNITGELLDLSQAETGNIQLNLQFVSPRDVVDLAVQAIRLQAEQKGVGLDVEVSETPPVQADLEKTAWVLVNFLSNAVRYSPENGRVSVKVIQKSDKVVFSVQDQGPGIAAQYQPRIFDKFFQVPGDIRGRSGTGLGLAIAKDFVTAQGGHIGVESESGHGSVFFFELNAA